MRIQKKTKQPKLNLTARGINKIKRAVQRDANKFEVSMSFVVCVILAQHYGIKEQEMI